MNMQSDLLLDRRLITFYGEVNEETSRSLIEKLLLLYGEHEGIEMKQVNEEPPLFTSLIEWKPIKLVISTYGGMVDEALSIYDVMRMIRDDCKIHTLGIGKVQSAGVLILASGTKGERKIGKNCQVMIHNLSAGMEGTFRDIDERYEYLQNLENQWNQCMMDETKLTKKKLDSLLKTKSDIFLTPEEVVKYGIADEIV